MVSPSPEDKFLTRTLATAQRGAEINHYIAVTSDTEGTEVRRTPL